jgi:hypothetical protein
MQWLRVWVQPRGLVQKPPSLWVSVQKRRWREQGPKAKVQRPLLLSAQARESVLAQAKVRHPSLLSAQAQVRESVFAQVGVQRPSLLSARTQARAQARELVVVQVQVKV